MMDVWKFLGMLVWTDISAKQKVIPATHPASILIKKLKHLHQLFGVNSRLVVHMEYSGFFFGLCSKGLLVWIMKCQKKESRPGDVSKIGRKRELEADMVQQ